MQNHFSRTTFLEKWLQIKCSTDCIQWIPVFDAWTGTNKKYMSMQCIVVRKYCLLMHNTHLCISVWNYFRRRINSYFYDHVISHNIFHTNFLWLYFINITWYFRTCMRIRMHIQKLFSPVAYLYAMWCFSEKSQLSKSIILCIT